MPCATKQAQLEYQRKWIAKRRAEWKAAHGPCVECRSWERLEIHHKDPRQKVTHNVWSYRKQRREAELKKCEVLCRDCHRKKTNEYRRSNYVMIHATIGAYRHGCRCELCRMYFAGVRKSYPSRKPKRKNRRKIKVAA